jgi:hypothetical protein
LRNSGTAAARMLSLTLRRIVIKRDDKPDQAKAE